MKLELGKLFFPRLPPDQRQREMRNLLIALSAGLVITGIMVTVMIIVAEMNLR